MDVEARWALVAASSWDMALRAAVADSGDNMDERALEWGLEAWTAVGLPHSAEGMR